MSQVLDLTAKQHTSGVLATWLAGRDGAAQRAGVQAYGENAVQTNLSYQELLSVLGIAGASAAGVNVTPESAMRQATVYACVDRITGAVSSMPIDIFERVGADRQPVEHDYHWMLNERACEDWSAADAWVYLLGGKFFYGDGYAELLRPSVYSSRTIGWKPHHPDRVRPFRDSKTKRKYYRIQPELGESYVLDQADMVQLTSLGYDGLTSPSPITYAAREAIATALAGQQFAGKLFSEGAVFDYALKTAGKLDEKQLADLKASLLARVKGSRAPLILTGGLEPASLTINPKDAEILSSRIFGVEEICRIFGVPPFMVGHTEKSSSWGTGLETQGANFVRYTLLPHLTKIAQELNHKLWPVRARYFIGHNTAALQQGDLESRYRAYRVGLGRAGEQPFLGVDEIRRRENLPPRELATNAPARADSPAPAPEPASPPPDDTGATDAT